MYSAWSFRSRISAKDDILNRVAVVKDLFQLVSACSGSFSSSKSIALLAPVVFKVNRLLFDLSGKELSSKREKKGAKEIRSLIEVILGYISVCSSGGSNENNGSNGSIKCLDDLIRVWMYGGEGKEDLTAFFPLVGAEISGQFGGGECDVDSLAGVVMAEAFLLKMCVYCRVGGSKGGFGEGVEELGSCFHSWVSELLLLWLEFSSSHLQLEWFVLVKKFKLICSVEIVGHSDTK